MTRKTILITGINGFLASSVGTAVLRAGHPLRGTCRALEKVKPLLEGPWKQYTSQIDIVIVPDITIPNAFDEAVEDVNAIAIMHMAAPVISNDITSASAELIEPTVTGTRNILASAQTHGHKLEIFILASSAGACITPGAKPPTVYTDASWNTIHPAIVEAEGDAASIFASYPVAKIRAEQAAWAVHATHPSPRFAVATICGSIATGPPALLPASYAQIPSTCKTIVDALRGIASPGPQEHIAAIAGAAPYTDIRDLAAVWLWCAENAARAAWQRYLVVAGHGPLQGVYDVLREAYPERVALIPRGADGGVRYNADWTFDAEGVRFDGGKAKRHTGIQFRSFRESVLDTAEALETFWRDV